MGRLAHGSVSSPIPTPGTPAMSSSPPALMAGPTCPPACLACLGRLEVLTANSYRNPAALPPGGVLVVGASASGVQIADELSRAGREVSLAVGRHTRMPRRYRGMDSFWWLAATGRLARTIDEMPDIGAARRENSLQLVGNPDPCLRGRDLDLGVLQARGVRLAGQARGRRRHSRVVQQRPRRNGRRRRPEDAPLPRRRRSVRRRCRPHSEVLPPMRPRPVKVSDPVSRLDLAAENIGTVLVAAGYRPYHPWLHLPVLAPDGSIRQRRGVTSVPGLYVVGQSFQHRRDSGFIDGARHDARLCGRPSVGPGDIGDPAAANRRLAA